MAQPATTENKEKRANRLRKFRIPALVLIYIIATALQFLFEHSEQLSDYFPVPGLIQSSITWVGGFFNSPFAYIPRPTEARYTALVSISDDLEGPLHGACEVRAFLAKLVPAIVAARPSIIVFDVALAGDNGYDACPTETQETKDLVLAFETAARSTPLVIGQASLKLENLPEERARRLRDNGFRENDLLLRKPIMLEPKPQDVAFGLVWPNQQVEKVPIDWYAHEAESSGAKPYPSLSLVAAKMYRSTFPKGNERLDRLESEQYHPISQLLREEAFALVPAISLLCDLDKDPKGWRGCSTPPTNDASNKLHGRIVVVGFSDRPDDQWETSAGRMPGYVLHANYIESLLDARAFRPLSFGMTCFVSLLWLLLVELPYWLLKLPIWKGIFFSVGISLVVVFLARYVALVNFGLFINLFTPSAFLVTVSVLHLLAKRFEE